MDEEYGILKIREEGSSFDYTFALSREELEALDRARERARVELPSINGHADFLKDNVAICYSERPNQHGTAFSAYSPLYKAIRAALRTLER